MKSKILMILIYFVSSFYGYSQGSGSALSFNGTSDVIQIPSGFQVFRPNNNYGLPRTLTCEFYFNIPSGGGGWVMGQSGGTPSFPHLRGSGGVYVDSSAIRYTWTSLAPDKTNVSFEAIGLTIASDEWHHVALVMDWQNEQAFIYLDGILQQGQLDQTVNNWGPDVTRNNTSHQFDEIGGCYFNNATSYFNGSLDEIRVWNYPLTHTLIKDWIGKKITSSHPNFNALRAYYNLDEGSGLTVNDLGGYTSHLPPNPKPNGTLTGSPLWQISGAPIGNEGLIIENSNGIPDNTTQSLTIPNLGVVTITISGGQPSSFIMYSVYENPNITSLPSGFNSLDNKYFGIKIFGGNNPEYTLHLDYSTHDSYTTFNDIKLAHRSNNSTINWTETTSNTDNVNNLIIANNLTGTEYILGASDCSLATPIASNDTICAAGTSNLSVSGSSGNYLWYDAPSGGNLLAEGSSFLTPHITETTNYFVAAYTNNISKDALEFDGINDHIVIGDLPNLRIAGDLTIEAWIYPTTYAHAQIYGKAAGGEGVLQMEGTGVISLAYGDGGNGGPPWYFINSGSQKPALNTWTHIAGVRDLTNGKLYLYFNGIMVAEKNETRPSSISNFQAEIGRSVSHFNGRIDEVRVWSMARSGTQLLENMNDCLVGNETNLQLYYRMDNGSGNTITDHSSNNYHGTLTNMDNIDWVNNGPDVNCVDCESTRTEVNAVISVDNFTLGEDICITGPTTLDAGSGFNSYMWNTGATTQSISVSSSGNYFCTISNQNNCILTDTVKVTLISEPITSGDSICSISTATLMATGGSGNYYWYDSLSGGNLIGTGNSITSPINNISTNYYASSFTTKTTNDILNFNRPEENYITIGDQANLKITGDQTIEMWINIPNESGNSALYSKATGGEGVLFIDGLERLSYTYGISGDNNPNTSQTQTIVSTSSISPNTWTHVAVVRNFSNSRIYLYINGVESASQPTNFPSAIASNQPAYVGRGYPSNIQSYITGSIDEVRVWSVARNTSQIQNNMNNCLNGAEKNLELYYKMDNLSGTILTDYSNNNYHGSLTNMMENDWNNTGSNITCKECESSRVPTSVIVGIPIPSNLATENIGEYSATLRWSEIQGALTYEIQYAIEGDSSINIVNLNAPIDSADISGLLPGANYRWRIRSSCDTTQTNFSSWQSFTTSGSALCLIPTGLAISNIGDTSATLNWNSVSAATNYQVQYRIAGVPNSSVLINSNTTQLELSNLSTGTNYELRVRSFCLARNEYSNYSSFSSITTLGAVACISPSNLNISNITNTSVNISWDTVAAASSYEIQYRIMGNPSSAMIVGNVSNNTIISGLEPGTDYEIRVKTVCTPGLLYSQYSSFENFSTNGMTSCPFPTNVITSNITDNSVDISWSAVTGAISYQIQYRIAGIPASAMIVATSATNTTISGLDAGTDYEIRVKTICTDGSVFSNYSFFQNFTTTGAMACAIPSGIVVSNVLDNSIDLNWNAVSGATSYQIQYRINGVPSAAVYLNISGTSTTISGLFSGTDYEVRLQTVCTAGSLYSDYSGFQTFSTTGGVACAIPSGVTTSNINNNTIDLSWNAIAGATSYQVQHREYGNPATNVYLTSNTNSISISGLSAGTNYEIRVKTVCTAGQLFSDYSQFQSFSTTGSMAKIKSIGFTSESNNLKLKVYPNPSEGIVYIRKQLLKKELIRVLIYNTVGTLIHQSEHIYSIDTYLNLKKFGAGIYMIKVLSEGVIENRRIVIQ